MRVSKLIGETNRCGLARELLDEHYWVRQMKMKFSCNRRSGGFTFIERIIGVSVVGLLARIAIPECI